MVATAQHKVPRRWRRRRSTVSGSSPRNSQQLVPWIAENLPTTTTRNKSLMIHTFLPLPPPPPLPPTFFCLFFFNIIIFIFILLFSVDCFLLTAMFTEQIIKCNISRYYHWLSFGPNIHCVYDNILCIYLKLSLDTISGYRANCMNHGMVSLPGAANMLLEGKDHQ